MRRRQGSAPASYPTQRHPLGVATELAERRLQSKHTSKLAPVKGDFFQNVHGLKRSPRYSKSSLSSAYNQLSCRAKDFHETSFLAEPPSIVSEVSRG